MRPIQALSVVGLAAALTLGACNRDPVPAQPVQPPAAATSQAPPVPPVGYACESGKTVTVQYPDTATANVAYLNQTYAMRTTPSPTGARYAGSAMEWWTTTANGQEQATLSRLGPNQDVGVAILERCSRPTSAPGTPAQPMPLPAPGETAPTTGSLAPPCRTNQLKLSSEGGDAGAGNRVAVLGAQNGGTQACSLNGYPTVTLLDGQGRSLTAIRAEQQSGNYFGGTNGPTPVTIAPQAKAYFDVAWSVVPNEAIGERTCPNAATVRVALPGDTAVVTLAQAFSPCGGRVRVRPFRAQAGDTAGG